MKIRFNYQEFLFGVLAFFLMIPFFKPNYIYAKMPELDKLFSYYLYGAILFILFYYIIVLIINKRPPSLIVVLISLYGGALILSTIINKEDFLASLREGVSYIALFALSELLLSKSVKFYLSVMTPIFNLLIIINFVTLIVWPNGMYRSFVISEEFWNSGNNWFLGYDNAFFAYVLPALLFSIIKYLYIDKTLFAKFKATVMVAIGAYSIISRWHATAVVCIIIFLFAFVLIQMKKLPAIANAKTYLWGNVAVFLGFVIIRVQEIFSYIIKNILGKDLTFSGRIEIWDLSLKSISQAPVFGYGIEDVTETVKKISINSSHNQYLWILYRGGLIHFLPFSVMIFTIVRRLYKNREFAYVKLTSVALCAIFILWQFEAISSYPLISILVFSYFVGNVPLGVETEVQEVAVNQQI